MYSFLSDDPGIHIFIDSLKVLTNSTKQLPLSHESISHNNYRYLSSSLPSLLAYLGMWGKFATRQTDRFKLINVEYAMVLMMTMTTRHFVHFLDYRDHDILATIFRLLG